MATLDGTWANSYVGIWTEAGLFRAAYAPGPREEVVIAKPDDQKQAIKTPSLGGFFLAAEGNQLVIYYIEHDTRIERRKETGITCGKQVMGALPQATGPMGPAGPKGDTGPRGPAGADGEDGEVLTVPLDQSDVDRIAQRVWTLEAGPHAGISGTDVGTMAQQNIAYPFTRQDVKVRELVAEDEAVKGLKDSGYTPKGT